MTHDPGYRVGVYVVDYAIRVRVGDKGIIFGRVREYLVREFRIHLIVNDKVLDEYALSPKCIEEFIYGTLYTSGLIKSISDVGKLKVKLSEYSIPSGKLEGVTKLECNVTVSAKHIVDFVSRFIGMSEVFKITGAVHSAALADPSKSNIVVFMEDIGRYNAIDKVIGWGLKNGVDFSKLVLLTSGRIFSGTVLKALKAGIPIVVSKAPPTYEAVELSREYGVTIIGFARGSRFNVYSYPERIRELRNSVNL